MPAFICQIRNTDLPYLILLHQFLNSTYIFASFYELHKNKSIADESNGKNIATRELTFFIIEEFFALFERELHCGTEAKAGYLSLNTQMEYYKKINKKVCNYISQSKYFECYKRVDDVPCYTWVPEKNETKKKFQAKLEKSLASKKQTTDLILRDKEMLIEEMLKSIPSPKQVIESQKIVFTPSVSLKPIAPKPTRFVQYTPIHLATQFFISTNTELFRKKRRADERGIVPSHTQSKKIVRTENNYKRKEVDENPPVRIAEQKNDFSLERIKISSLLNC